MKRLMVREAIVRGGRGILRAMRAARTTSILMRSHESLALCYTLRAKDGRG